MTEQRNATQRNVFFILAVLYWSGILRANTLSLVLKILQLFPGVFKCLLPMATVEFGEKIITKERRTNERERGAKGPFFECLEMFLMFLLRSCECVLVRLAKERAQYFEFLRISYCKQSAVCLKGCVLFVLVFLLFKSHVNMMIFRWRVYTGGINN